MTRAVDDLTRSKELLAKLGLEETPARLDAVRATLMAIRDDQKAVDGQLCNHIAGDGDGSLGEEQSDLAELARQCALAIETGDPGVCDEVPARGAAA